MTLIDLTGDRRSDLLITSPWGLGVVGWTGNALSASLLCPNGGHLGDWALDTKVNRVQLLGDLDGDGTHEAILSSPWGIGVVGFAGGHAMTKAMAANGTRVGGWVVDTTSNRFLHAVDVEGDARSEILVTSPWGIGLLSLDGGGVQSHALTGNGGRLGDWLLDTAINWFPVKGDLDGDGRHEIVSTSAWGLGVLKVVDGVWSSVAMVANGTRIGDWTLDTATDRIEAAADLDGDGRAELVLSGPGGLVVLGLSGESLVAKAAVAPGDAAGEWRLDPVRDGVLAVGDVDGDGRAEIVLRSDWGIGVVALEGTQLQSRLMAPNGTRLGGWNLNTADNRIAVAVDIDGDGRDEVVVTSPWGLGVLHLGGPVGDALTLAANGTGLGEWRLDTTADDLLAGHAHAWGVMLRHPDWGGAVNDTEQVLRDRGFAVLETDSADAGKELLARLSRVTRSADRVFVYLAGHGATSRAVGDYAPGTAMTHIVQLGDGGVVSLQDLAPCFELIADKGADLAVFDGSCEGGESVIAATGKRYVALSTTGAQAPGLTNTPDPGSVMKSYGQPSHFGLWWSGNDAASVLSGNTPHRFYQKIYRSDETDVARWSVFYRTAIGFLSEMAYSWDLVTRGCYLFEYVYADQYNEPNPAPEVVAYKASTPVSLADYLASMQADHDGYAPSIAQLHGYLGDHALVGRAATVYADAFPRPWLTVSGDLAWNIVQAPAKVLDNAAVLMPLAYSGAAGFAALVQDCIDRLNAIATSWETQATHLHQLDLKLRGRHAFRKVEDMTALRAVFTISGQLQRSHFDEARRAEHVEMLTALREGSPLPIRQVPRAHGADAPVALAPTAHS